MKISRFVLLVGAMFGLASATSARTGESVSQVIARYGNPKQFKGPAVENPTAMKGTPKTPDVANPNAFKWAEFEYNGFSVTVQFIQGKSVQEEYRRSASGKLHDKDIEALLQANSDGKKWTQADKRHWTREDGADAGRTDDGAFFVRDSKLAAAGRAERENAAKAPTGF